MSLLSFFMFIIVLVVVMIVLSYYGLFLVFHIWVSIAMVNVRTSFLVLGGSDNADIVNICCNDVYSFLVRFFNSFAFSIKMIYILCLFT